MLINKKIGAYIDAARSNNQSRPTLTRVDVTTAPVPYFLLEENDCILAATDGYRLHLHQATRNGAEGICTIGKYDRNHYLVQADPLFADTRYPDYRATIPRSGEWLTMTDWPRNLTPSTAKGMAKAGLFATFVARQGNLRFSGFHSAGFSLEKRKEAGAIIVNPWFIADACQIDSQEYSAYYTNPNFPLMIRPQSDMGALAVIMPHLASNR